MYAHRYTLVGGLTLLLAVPACRTVTPVAVEVEAEPRGVVALSPSPDLPAFDPAKSAGLFVGVRNFLQDKTLREVPYAVDDAIDLAHLLAIELEPPLIPPERVHLALSGEPQKAESSRRLAELRAAGAAQSEATYPDVGHWLEKQAASAAPGGLLVVSFATHGIVVRGVEYLLTASSLDRFIPKTSISVRRVDRIVSLSRATRSLVFLDACREPHQAKSTLAPGPKSPGLLAAFANEMGPTVLSALAGETLYDDPARRQGVFTAAVLDGLRCGAEQDARGFVTVAALAEFINRRVLSWAQEATLGTAPRTSGIEYRLGGSAGELPLAFCGRGSHPRNKNDGVLNPRAEPHHGAPDPTGAGRSRR